MSSVKAKNLFDFVLIKHSLAFCQAKMEMAVWKGKYAGTILSVNPMDPMDIYVHHIDLYTQVIFTKFIDFAQNFYMFRCEH